MYKRPKLELQTTTLWEYPSQHYGEGMQGDKNYKGATPSYVIWNLLKRYTREDDVVLDPMCGSGTTLDVAHDLKRRGIGFDLQPYRRDIGWADARDLPIEDESVDFVFIDPPYSTHLKYSGDKACIGELDAVEPAYYEAMEKVIDEIYRVLKDKRYMALYVQDSYRNGMPFCPIGFELFQRLRKRFKAIDVVCVTRYNKTLNRGHWHRSAQEGNYFLRGFNYLFIMKKDSSPDVLPATSDAAADGEKASAAGPAPGSSEKARRKRKRRRRL